MSALPSPPPPAARRSSSVTLDKFDRGFRRRIVIALAVSVAVNLVIFGYAGKLGHQFLQSLEVVRERDGQVSIRRVTITPSQMRALQRRPRTPLSTPHASPTPATTPTGADARL